MRCLRQEEADVEIENAGIRTYTIHPHVRTATIEEMACVRTYGG